METAHAGCTQVFIAEDSAAIRMRLSQMLDGIPDVTVVGEADTPASAIDGILRNSPTLVVLDLKLIGGSGMEVLRSIKPARPEIVFIVLTNSTDPQYRNACMQAGAGYFLDKSTEFGSIRNIIADLHLAH